MADVIKGTQGNDRLYVSSYDFFDKDVTAYGYGGNDTFEVSFTTRATIYGGGGNDSLTGGGYDGSVFYGGGGDDRLDGWISKFSALYGGAGNDWLRAGREDCILDGGTGIDTMTGGDGGNVFVVDNVSDVVIETFRPSFDNVPNPRDEVRSSVSWSLGKNLEDLTLTGSEKINGTGNSLSNTINGNAAANVLKGGGGNDRIDGGGGNDNIFGDGGNDRLLGGSGNDVLNGGKGRDTMIGGHGNDVFRFSSKDEAHGDRICGGDGEIAFSGVGRAAGDRIDLRGIDANLSARGDQAVDFGRATKIGDLWTVEYKGNTLVRGNIDGKGAYDFQIVIEDGRGILASDYTAHDFLL